MVSKKLLARHRVQQSSLSAEDMINERGTPGLAIVLKCACAHSSSHAMWLTEIMGNSLANYSIKDMYAIEQC